VIDGRRGSYKRESVGTGGEITREGFDWGFCLIYNDGDSGEVTVTQTPETNTVAMGKYVTVIYDRQGELVGLDISLLCVGMMSAMAGIPASVQRAGGLSDYVCEHMDMRMIVDLESNSPGVTFLEMNSKGPSLIVGGDLLRPTTEFDHVFDGPTPLFGLPVTVFQDHRALYVTVAGEDGYSWVQFSRNHIDPRLIGYGLSAQEMTDLFQIAFPPPSFLAEDN